ncbi:hypothetical protein KKI24_23940 [bacterium]|nr:hypothetical protein [bacterium]
MLAKSNKKQLLKTVALILLFGLWPLLFSSSLLAEDKDPFAEPATSGTDDFSETEPAAGTTDAFADTGDTPLKAARSLEWTGFLEIEQGSHIGKSSVVDKQWVLSNRRFRLATQSNTDMGSVFLKADFIEDSVARESRVDLREARVVVTPIQQMDLSIGKQVNTWGVADMLFINDLFPKNWISNFLGRDMESMKDAANSFRLTGYLGNLVLDVVYHPEFAPDTTPTGCRLSVYNPNSQTLVANSSSCGSSYRYVNQPGETNGETAVRLKFQLGSYELAAYTYSGYFKNPKGLQRANNSGSGTGETGLVAGQTAGYTTLMAYYPKLQVQGASLEGQLGPGIMTFETGLYQSLEDKDGENPLIENGKWKYLLGYRMDLTAHLGVGAQWYQEQMLQYDAYEKAVGTYFPQTYEYRRKERQNTYTLRLTVKAQQETLWINLFRYQRPEDRDAFTKLDITKRLNDSLEMVVGTNVFEGEDHYEDREFGMLKNDDNLFARVKYNF